MAINTQLRRTTDPAVFHSRLAICHLLCAFFFLCSDLFLKHSCFYALSRSLLMLPRIRACCILLYCVLFAVVLQYTQASEERRCLQLRSRRRQCHGILGDIRSSVVERDSKGWYCVTGRGRNPSGTGKEFLRLKYCRSCITRYCIITSSTSVRELE